MLSALIAAEPVRPHIVENFFSKFGRTGFSRSALRPCYGLAESVVGSSASMGIRTIYVDTNKLERENVVVTMPAPTDESTTLIASGIGAHCGVMWEGTGGLIIVDPDTRSVVPEGRVGEIWIHGMCIGSGCVGALTLSVSCANSACNNAPPPPRARPFTHNPRHQILEASGAHYSCVSKSIGW